ncbi:DNA-binding protein [Xanthomonas perforans]|uniref:DNA-binding protein n=1 Tax=Xanthomonas perforans TaxID=442694 RepID=A0ABR5EKN8_XANPE|nr:helix-turn-helix transcriptional regulator [Xanthomonas perforans]KLC00931.1 DNA-binding protein [Xanthomonas perforans]
MDLDDARLIFANRLRHARQKAELTQEALGVAAGLAPEVARTRINRYEKGVNECDLRTAKRLADALGMPLAAFFAAKLSVEEQRKVVAELQLKAQGSNQPSP